MNTKFRFQAIVVTVMFAALSSGCATEMLGQCAMKSVSSDPLYGVGCGVAMATTAVVVVGAGAIAVKEKIEEYQKSKEAENSGVHAVPQPCTPDGICSP